MQNFILHLTKLIKKTSTDLGENISKNYWPEGVKNTVFRPNSPLFAQRFSFKLPPFDAKLYSASYKTNQKKTAQIQERISARITG
jgi:hypothetical protein